jgi:hypothetical protein
MNLDDRLRAAGAALREGSVIQVDAATRLREMLVPGDLLVPRARGAVLVDEPQPPASLVVTPVPAAQALVARRSRRWAVVLNLLLVLGLGVALGIGLRTGYDTVGVRPTPPASTVVRIRTKVQVPGACLKANDEASAAISYLVGGIRDRRLEEALKAYNTAKQQCLQHASR